MSDGNETLTLSDDQTDTLNTFDNNGNTDFLDNDIKDPLEGDGDKGKDKDKNKNDSGGGGDGGNSSPPPDPDIGDNGNPGGSPNLNGPSNDGGNEPNEGNDPNKEVVVQPNTEGDQVKKNDQEGVKGGGARGLSLPLLTGVPFTASDVSMKSLDTSGYRSKRKAAKASTMYETINKSVQSRIGQLVGIANQITKLHADIDAAASQHLAGLKTSQETLKTNIANARAALSSESEAAAGRVRATLTAERGTIREAASTARSGVDTAAQTMKNVLSGAKQRSLKALAGGFDTAAGITKTGAQDYRDRLKERMGAVNQKLAIPGKDALWTCVHYRMKTKLGKQFADNGPLMQNLAKLEEQNNTLLTEAFAVNQGKLNDLVGKGRWSAESARRKGKADIDSYEKSALKELDETERSVLSHIETATTQANASLDTVEQHRGEAISQATQQTGIDAENLKKNTEAALWAHAHAQSDQLVKTAESAAEPLGHKAKKAYVEDALKAVSNVPLDLTTATQVSQQMVAGWAAGHARIRGDLDGSTNNGAAKWKADALKRVKDAEARSVHSVQTTSKGSQDGLNASAEKIAAQIKGNSDRAVGAINRQASALNTAMSNDARAFVVKLETHTALDTSALTNIDANLRAAHTKLDQDFIDRASRAHAAMFDAGLLNGTDETKLFAALRGIGAYGADALALVYRRKKNRDLYADVYNDLTRSEYKIAKAYLDNRDGEGVKLELAYHRSGFWGPDEDAIKNMLKDLSPEQLESVKQQPGWEEAEKALYQDLKGDDLNLRVVQSLVAGNKARAEALELIDKIVDARWDENEDALRTAIEGIPADKRGEILVQFAVLQELANQQGGMDKIDFTKKEVDEELAKKMGETATDKDGNVITSTNDDLTERNVTVAEQRFGEWATKDKLQGDNLYKEGGPGFTDVAQTTLALSVVNPMGVGMNAMAAYQMEKSGVSNDRSLNKDFKDLVRKQSTYGSTSMEGRSAGIRYESQTGGNSERAYKNLKKDHLDENGNVKNSAFKTDQEREESHEEWRNKLNEVHQKQYGTSVKRELSSSDEFSRKETKLLQEARKGGQGSADTMFDYAKDGSGFLGMGTNEWAAENALEGASRKDIDAYFKARPDARADLLSEFSGDELEKMRILMVGKVTTDKQRWEIAKIRYDFTRGSGAGDLNIVVAAAMGPMGGALMLPGAPKISTNHFWDLLSGAGTVMDYNFEQMSKMIEDRGGEDRAFDENGMLIVIGGDENAYEEQREFRGQGESLEDAETTYKATTDAYTNLIATVAGIAAGALLSIVTAGAAAPAVVALVSGLTTMATKAALKGDRYGWEEMAKDGAMLGVEVATAGLASKLTKAAKISQLKKVEGIVAASDEVIAAYKLPKTIELGLQAGEAFVSSTGKTLMDEKTYEKGVGEGILKAVAEGGKGAAGKYVGAFSEKMSGEIFGGIEKQFNIQKDWARQALSVPQAALSNYTEGQINLAISDIVTNENNFKKDQLKVAESAMFTGVSKMFTAKRDLEAGDLGQQYENDKNNSQLKQQLDNSQEKQNELKRYVDPSIKTTQAIYEEAKKTPDQSKNQNKSEDDLSVVTPIKVLTEEDMENERLNP